MGHRLGPQPRLQAPPLSLASRDARSVIIMKRSFRRLQNSLLMSPLKERLLPLRFALCRAHAEEHMMDMGRQKPSGSKYVCKTELAVAKDAEPAFTAKKK